MVTVEHEFEVDGVDEVQAAAKTEAFYQAIMTWLGDYLGRE
jgi:hypothetical protein